jgi:hypothetical protein
MATKRKNEAFSPYVLDYPSSMSMYERESLAAEAKIRVAKRLAKKAQITTRNESDDPNVEHR